MSAHIGGTRIHYIVEGVEQLCMIASMAETTIYERTFSATLRRHLKMIFVAPGGNRSDVGAPADLDA